MDTGLPVNFLCYHIYYLRIEPETPPSFDYFIKISYFFAGFILRMWKIKTVKL